MKTISTQIVLCNKCGKCAIITSNCFLTRNFESNVNTLKQVLIENKKCQKTITCSITNTILYRSWIARSSLGLLKEVCEKIKQRPWIVNSGLGMLNYQKTIFTKKWTQKSFAGLGLLNQAIDRRKNYILAFRGSPF